MRDFVFKQYKDIYAFQKDLEKPTNSYFEGNEHSKNHDRDWYQTEDFEEAENLLKNGWNEKVKEFATELRNFSATIERNRVKNYNSVCGFAPIVPNAIKGVPKSMLASKKIKSNKKLRTVHLIINNTASGGTDGDELIKTGLTSLKLAVILGKKNIRTKIDILPKISGCGESVYGCAITIKDYKQPFDISKIAYPLAHTSMFRRHGFRWLETLPEMTNREFVDRYGRNFMRIGETLRTEYKKYAGFDKDDVLYIEVQDVQKADYDPFKLAEMKGIKLN